MVNQIYVNFNHLYDMLNVMKFNIYLNIYQLLFLGTTGIADA